MDNMHVSEDMRTRYDNWFMETTFTLKKIDDSKRFNQLNIT